MKLITFELVSADETEKKADQHESKSDDENNSASKDTPTVKKAYDPTLSFFDNLAIVPPKT